MEKKGSQESLQTSPSTLKTRRRHAPRTGGILYRLGPSSRDDLRRLQTLKSTGMQNLRLLLELLSSCSVFLHILISIPCFASPPPLPVAA